uniref:Uncharacterized protein n=1 Tax=Arundo donax TaxID=35708 RepID=A0A0A9AXC3_ARUDO
MLILIDSGSSHSFINSSFAKRVGVQTVQMKPAQVKVANGEMLVSNSQIKGLEWWTQGQTFHTDMKVLELGAYDAILGMDWLKPRSPMNCHWEQKTIEFEEQGKRVKLQGVTSDTKRQQVTEMSAEQLLKWSRGNDVWSMVMVENVQQQQANVK